MINNFSIGNTGVKKNNKKSIKSLILRRFPQENKVYTYMYVYMYTYVYNSIYYLCFDSIRTYYVYTYTKNFISYLKNIRTYTYIYI